MKVTSVILNVLSGRFLYRNQRQMNFWEVRFFTQEGKFKLCLWDFRNLCIWELLVEETVYMILQWLCGTKSAPLISHVNVDSISSVLETLSHPITSWWWRWRQSPEHKVLHTDMADHPRRLDCDSCFQRQGIQNLEGDLCDWH